jgi:hypothetical protein
MREEQSGGGGKAMGVILILVVIGAGYYAYTKSKDTPKAKLAAEQAYPEASLRLYMRTAYQFIHEENDVAFPDVQKCVTKDDWQWYQDNCEKLVADPLAVTNAMNPIDARAGKHFVALRGLLEFGPCREDCEIIKRDIGEERCVFTVRVLTTGYENGYRDVDVELVKEGGVWKVKDFAGGRAALSMGGSVAPAAALVPDAMPLGEGL